MSRAPCAGASRFTLRPSSLLTPQLLLLELAPAMPSPHLLFINGPIYTGSSPSSTSLQGQAILCDPASGKILAVGDEDAVRSHAAASSEAQTVDLRNRFLLPTFLDSHVHISLQGVGLEKVDLDGCSSLEEIQERLRDGIAAAGGDRGEVLRIQAKRFVPQMLGRGREDGMRREWLDECSEGGKAGIVVEARDLHSVSRVVRPLSSLSR